MALIQPGSSNGTTESAVAEALQDEMTVGYRPTMPLEALWLTGGGDVPQVTLRRDLEFMQIHPIVCVGLEYYKSGIAGAEFWGGPDQKDPTNDNGKPISPDERVSQFVLAHVERFWQRGVPLLQEGGYPYGWAPGEHIYKEASGYLVWSHLKSFHPNDGFVLSLNNEPIGVRIKNIRDASSGSDPGGNTTPPSGGVVNLWLASESVPAKAAWYSHRPRFNTLYGRSQLISSWRPWRRLGWRDGVEQIVDAAIYRAGYSGPLGRYPPGHSAATAKQGVPATTADSQGNPRRENRDVMRQIIEWAKAGAGIWLSSEVYPGTNQFKWDLKWPEHVMDVRPLIEAARYLEDQILLGMGVPPELIRAGGTGSGYSGRSIPREAFLDQQQRIADAMLQMFVEQVIRPLVLWNFGDIPFNVQCKPLLQTQAGNKQGDEQDKASGGQAGQPDSFNRSQAAKDSWAQRKGANGTQMPAQPTDPGGALSMDNPAFRRRVLDIVADVIRRRRAA